MAKKLKSLNPIIGTGYKTLSTIKDGEDGNIENFPDTLPKIPRLSYKRLGVSGLEIGWEFEDKIYYTYELYGSTTKGFEASEENLMFQGLASSYFYEAKPGEKWYFKARAKNTHGRYTEFSSELVTYTVKLDNLGEYVEGGSINGALIENATINNAHIKDLHADKITAGVLDADRIGANSITANKIEANAITTEKIQANAITTDKLAANIIASNHIQSSTIESGHIKAGTIESDHIKSNSINSNHIQANTIQSEHIQANTIQSEHIQTGAITAGSGIIAEGAIGSAQISSLDAAKIEAGTIDTSKVTIQGADGHLRLKGNRMQVFQGTGNQAKERVSLGDVNGNGSVYGLRVRGADGTTILLDENGVKSEGITDGAITNDKISDDANIDGAKLNINSVVNKINEDGTETIQGTKIEVDGTTLNTKLSTITTKQTEDSERISQAQSQITANTNAIKLKVDEQTYTTDKKDMTSKLEKNTSEISAMKGQIALKVEQTDITNTINNLKIGGKNLLLNSAMISSSNWSSFSGTIVNGYKPNVNAMRIDNSSATSGYVDKLQQEVHNGTTKLLEPSSWYTFSFYVKGSGKLKTHIYPSLIDTSIKGYADEQECTLGSDGNKDWNLTDVWTRHTYTFKTRAEIPATSQKVLFRVYYGNDVYICMPQLEKGNKASDWNIAPEDIDSNTDKKINSAKAEIKVTTDAISQNVSNLSQTVSTKADGSTVTTLSNKVGSLETSVNGISGKVSSLEKTTTTLGGQVSNAQNTADSAVSKANNAQLTANTANSTANANKGNITNLQGEVSTIKSDVASLEVTTSGISQKVSSVESTTASLSTQVTTAQNTANSAQSTANSANSNATNALNKANDANILASSKAKVFTSTPTVPYQVGDLWVQGTNGDVMKCKTARTSGSYTASDWEKASKYTDDTKANAVDNKVTNLQAEYNKTKTQVAEIVTDLNGITQRVSSTESTTTTLTNRVNTVESTADSVNNKLNNLTIGGRNYIKDSKSVYMKPNGTSNYDLTFSICDSFWENENRFGTVILSFDVEPDEELSADFSSNVWFRAEPWYSFPSWTYPKRTKKKKHYTLQASLKNAETTYKTTQLFVRFQTKDTIGMTFTNVKLEISTKPSDWTPAPEDIDSNLNDVKNSLNSFQNTVNTTFKDGIIEEAEAKAISQHLKTLDAEKADIDKEYSTIYGNSLLGGAAKTNLANAKTSFDSAHSSLKSTINTVISDGKVNSTEKASVDSTFTTYNGVLGTYKQRVQEALDAISSAKVNNIQIGGRNIIGKDINNISKWSLNYPERFSISNVEYDNTLIYKTTGGGWETAISNGIAVIPNKEYVLSFEYEVFNEYSYLSGETFRLEVLSERITGNSSKHKAIAFHTIENVATPKKRVYITFTPTTSTIYLMINGGYIADGLQNLKFSFNKFKLEKGNKATDWTPAPEDIDDNIADVKNSLSGFQNTVNTTFKDGIIEQAEAKAIAQHLKTLDAEKADIDKEYSAIYSNANLTGSAKTNLASAKTSFDSAHASLKSTINTVISDGRVSSSESASVTSTFNTYNTQLGVYKQRIQEALDAISSAKVNNIEVGGRNLLINCAKYTSSSPLNTQSASKDGYAHHNSICTPIELEVGTYVMQAETNGTWSSTHNTNGMDSSKKYCSLWLVSTTNGNNVHQFIDMTRSVCTVNIPRKGTYFLRTNIYSDGATNVSVNFWNIKLEKGNKKTGYSPASEDIDGAINSVDSKVDTLRTEYNSTKSKVATLETDLSGITSRVSNVENTTTTVKNDLANLTVGGRNLIQNSAPNTTSGWSASTNWTLSLVDCASAPNGKAIRSTNSNNATSGGLHKPPVGGKAKLIDGETYTVSAWIRASKSCKADFKHETMVSSKQIDLTTSWKYYTFTSKININATYNSNVVYITNATIANGMWIEVHSFKLEKGNKATDWSEAPEEISGSITSLTSRVSTAESKITEDAITNTVKKNFYTKSETDNQITSKGYQTESQVQQTVNGLQVKVSQSGGYNLLKNSSGLGGVAHWLNSANTFEGYTDTNIKEQTSCGKGFRLGNNSTSEKFAHSHRFLLQKGKKYTVSGKYYVGSGNKGIDVFLLTSNTIDATGNNSLHSYDNAYNCVTSGTHTGKWQSFSKTITVGSTTKSAVIRLDNNGSDTNGTMAYSYFADLVVEEGELSSQWTPHPSEIYDGVTTIDKDGVTVTASNVKSKTNMSANGFKITKTDTNEDVFKVNSDGTLYMKGSVTVTSGNAKDMVDRVVGWTYSGTTEINGGNIRTGTLSASKITAGTLDASKVNVTNLNASNITSGTISGNRIASNSITADKIAVGAISVDRLSSNNENPIIKLFDNCSIDATEKYEQGKGNAIRIKWDSMNYILQKKRGVDFYMEPREDGNAFGFQSDYGQHTNNYESRIVTRDGTLCFRRTNNNDESTSSLFFYTGKNNHTRKLLTSYDLTSSVTSESTTMPATAYGVKQAYDKAVSAYNVGNHPHPYAPSSHPHDKINYNSTKVECYNGYIVFDAGSAYFRMDNGSNHGGAYKLYPIGAGNDLGSPYSNNTYRWRTVYSQSSLNTSDVKNKEDICYLDDNIARFGRNNTPFLDFIKNDFRPATYMYKVMREEEGHVDADRQIGFIANDIIDTEVGKTFLYNFGTEEETDIMFSPTGYTTVVARALQEEIKRREELEAKCVDLEERLIKLEKILESKL